MNSASAISVIVPAATEFGRQILQGVRTYCKQHPGMSINLVSTGDIPTTLTERRDNPLVASVSNPKTLKTLSSFFSSTVGTSNRQVTENFACVLNDDVAVGRMGAEYLLSLGYRHLAFLSHAGFQYSFQREEGFRKVVEQAGATLHIFEDCRQTKMPQVAAELLGMDDPVAVMASSDLVARWLIENVPHASEVTPDRMAILGVDDDPLENNLSAVSISSIRLSGERLGYEAAALAVRLAKGEKLPTEPILIAPARIVMRQSTSKLAVRDKWIVRVIKTMRENLTTIADVSDVVAALPINRRPLEMRFQRILGSSIATELTKLRIHRARELLATTDISIKEIAYLVGYSEPRMLSIAFKRETGERPIDFRKRVAPEAH
jgi:LacI family transcriptional regulator